MINTSSRRALTRALTLTEDEGHFRTSSLSGNNGQCVEVRAVRREDVEARLANRQPSTSLDGLDWT